MSLRFVPCTECDRHVKGSDPSCPFCGAKVICDAAPARAPIGRVARSTLFAAGAVGAAIATGACSATPMYGGPPAPYDAGSQDGGADSSADGSFQTLYGGPPQPPPQPEAGADATPMPLYGAAPPNGDLP